MKRIFAEYAYGAGPRDGCWWDDTTEEMVRPELVGSLDADVAIVGGGFTGLSAALHLTEAGLKVVVLDARFPGWGASGRNGGFCCLGGGMLDDGQLDAQFGRSGRLAFRIAERAAVDLVEDLVDRLGIEIDRHSHGETELAHRRSDMRILRNKAADVAENYGVSPQLIEVEELADHGMSGPFFGGLTIPIGFGLNPAKYLRGLAQKIEANGGEIYHGSEVRALQTRADVHHLRTPRGEVRARHAIIATNGYSSENLEPRLAGRYLPSQSNVLVTRQLSQSELDAQGWTSTQMCYDSRHLLHYFRLMPDRRFLFGMRGGVLTGQAAERRARRRISADFKAFFPAWTGVEVTHQWSGMVCLARNRLPFVGELERGARIWAGMCYHGNGVAMATLSGKILAQSIAGTTPDLYPDAMHLDLRKFPLGRWRRAAMPPLFWGLALADR